MAKTFRNRTVKGPRLRKVGMTGELRVRSSESYKGSEVWAEEVTKAVGKDLQDCANPAVFHYGQSRTTGLPNFSSIKVEVGLSMPCLPEMVEDTKELVMDKVNQELEQELNRLLGK